MQSLSWVLTNVRTNTFRSSSILPSVSPILCPGGQSKNLKSHSPGASDLITTASALGARPQLHHLGFLVLSYTGGVSDAASTTPPCQSVTLTEAGWPVFPTWLWKSNGLAKAATTMLNLRVLWDTPKDMGSESHECEIGMQKFKSSKLSQGWEPRMKLRPSKSSCGNDVT